MEFSQIQSMPQALPVQWGFKHRMPDGRVLDLLLRRVKAGSETPVEFAYDGPRHVSGYGRFSDSQTLLMRFDDTLLASSEMSWARDATHALLLQAEEVCRYQPALWQLFCPKGKIELYAPQARSFEAQYISSNYTMKCHADALLQPQANLLLSILAQHLDYPFGSGERRFSTTRLFDLCFAAEKHIAPMGLAGRIDALLEQRGLFQPQRHVLPNADHVADLLNDASAAIGTSYERVLQRERFAALMRHWYGSPLRGVKSPILQHYQQFIELDLALHQQHDFKNYPAPVRDDLALSLHLPLAMVFRSNTPNVNTANYNAQKGGHYEHAATAAQS